MKKFLKILFVLSCILIYSTVNAKEKLRVDYNDVNLREGPGTNYRAIKKLGVSSTFDLVEKTLFPNEKGCPDGWYKIYYSGQNVGFVCASYITLYEEKDTPVEANTACEKEMASLGFPNTYWNGLCSLK